MVPQEEGEAEEAGGGGQDLEGQAATEAPPGMWKRCAKRKSKPNVPRPKPPVTPKTFEKTAF